MEQYPEAMNVAMHQKRGITHLFMDSAGTFHSAMPACILTGIFFYELDRDNATIDELIQEL